MRYFLIIAVSFLALLCQATEAEAQETLPRIGVLKWTITSPDMWNTESVAYARNADIFFVGTSYGYVLVVDTEQGQIVDTINLRAYPGVWEKIKGQSQQRVIHLGATHDGSLIAFGIDNTVKVGTVMIEYPSKRLLDSSERGLGLYDHYPPQGLVLSSKGRFLAMDYGVVIDRQTGKTWKTTQRAQFGWMCFDEAETMLAYRTDSVIKGATFDGFVVIQPLADTGIAPVNTGLYGFPAFSADGSKLMTSGGTGSVSEPRVSLESKAVVMDLSSREILWELRSNGEPDFGLFAWSPDVKTYYGYRTSSWLPENERYRLYRWNVGDEKPNAIFDMAGASYTHLQLFNNEMTEMFDASFKEIFAVDLTQTPTSIAHDSASSKPDTIYPNPTTGMAVIECETNDIAKGWRLTSMDGRLVASGESIEVLVSSEGRQSYRIRVPSDIPSGMYILSMHSSSNTIVCTVTMVKQ